MCDYSLESVKSRAAKIGDVLTTRNFGNSRGFAAAEDCDTAVCVLPGTELAFRDPIQQICSDRTGFVTAIFRQLEKGIVHRHHDALELPDGNHLRLTNLCEGQVATVLQLPAQEKPAEEAGGLVIEPDGQFSRIRLVEHVASR